MATVRKRPHSRSLIRLPEASAFGIASYHENWININTREIWIHGIETDTTEAEGAEPGVEYMMATKVIKNLHILRALSPKRPIVVHLHTEGGDYTEGMAIYDTVRAMPYPVTMVSYTHARSMSSLILQAADTRVLMPNSYFLFHWGTNGFEGTHTAFESYAKFCERTKNVMLDIYGEKMKERGKFSSWSLKRIQDYLRHCMEKKEDVYLSAQEAVDWGLADHVFTGDWNKFFTKTNLVNTRVSTPAE